MSSESVCQVACSWVDVGSFHTRLFGVVLDLWQFSRWIRERNSECASDFETILGKVLWRPSQ